MVTKSNPRGGTFARLSAALALAVVGGCGGAYSSLVANSQSDLAEVQKQCKGAIAQLTAVPARPVSARFDGRWQCMYATAGGASVREYITISTTGNKASITGNDSSGENVMGSGSVGGTELAYTTHELAGARFSGDAKGQILVGETQYYAEDMGTCHKTAYQCRRF